MHRWLLKGIKGGIIIATDAAGHAISFERNSRLFDIDLKISYFSRVLVFLVTHINWRNLINYAA